MSGPIDFEQLARVAGDAVIISDAKGAITFWNTAAERIFGFTEQDALGQSLDLIIPERQRQRHWDGYHETMRTGVTRYGTTLLRVPAIHKDGHALSIAFTVALLTSPAGEPTHIVSVIRDETARWKEERDLRKRLADAETQMKAATQA